MPKLATSIPADAIRPAADGGARKANRLLARTPRSLIAISEFTTARSADAKAGSMNTNGSTPAGSVRSISTSPPASSVHSFDGSGGGRVVAATTEEGAVVEEGSGTETVVVVSTKEVGGGSGRESLPVVAVEGGTVVEEGSGTETVVVVTTEEVGAAGEGPSSAGVTPSSAAHPPATMAIANRTPSTGTHALAEYPTALTGRILSTVNGSRPGCRSHRPPRKGSLPPGGRRVRQCPSGVPARGLFGCCSSHEEESVGSEHRPAR